MSNKNNVKKFQKRGDEYYFEKGKDYAKKRDFKNAIYAFTKAIKKLLKHFEDNICWSINLALYYHQRGLAYTEDNQYAQSIADYNNALYHTPGDIEVYYSRAISYFLIGESTKSLADLTKIVKINQEEIIDDDLEMLAHSLMGHIYFDHGKYHEAIIEYTKAIALDTNIHKIYFKRGLAKVEEGNIHEAISDFKISSRMKLKIAEKHINDGDACYDAGNYDGAILVYGKATGIYWMLPEAHRKRGKAYEKKGDHYNASEQFRFADDFENKGDPELQEACSYFIERAERCEHDDDLFLCYDKALQIDPNNAYALSDCARAYWEIEELDKAKYYYSKAIENDPKNYWNYYDRAMINKEQEDYASAILDLDYIIKHDGYIIHETDIYLEKATLCEKEGRIAEALETYKSFKSFKEFLIKEFLMQGMPISDNSELQFIEQKINELEEQIQKNQDVGQDNLNKE